MLMYQSVKYLSSFFCPLYNCVSVGYNKLLFHEQCATSIFMVNLIQVESEVTERRK